MSALRRWRLAKRYVLDVGHSDTAPRRFLWETRSYRFLCQSPTRFFAFSVARCAVGIDIERKNQEGLSRLGDDVFSSFERKNIIQWGDPLALRYWVRKEALTKAQGVGIAYPLRFVDVSKPYLGRSQFDSIYVEGRQGKWLVSDIPADSTDCLLSVAIPLREADYAIKVLQAE